MRLAEAVSPWASPQPWPLPVTMSLVRLAMASSPWASPLLYLLREPCCGCVPMGIATAPFMHLTVAVSPWALAQPCPLQHILPWLCPCGHHHGRVPIAGPTSFFAALPQ